MSLHYLCLSTIASQSLKPLVTLLQCKCLTPWWRCPSQRWRGSGAPCCCRPVWSSVLDSNCWPCSGSRWGPRCRTSRSASRSFSEKSRKNIFYQNSVYRALSSGGLVVRLLSLNFDNMGSNPNEVVWKLINRKSGCPPLRKPQEYAILTTINGLRVYFWIKS